MPKKLTTKKVVKKIVVKSKSQSRRIAIQKNVPTVVDLKVGQTLDTKTGEISNKCLACNGSGLENPNAAGSPLCPRCSGSCVEPT